MPARGTASTPGYHSFIVRLSRTADPRTWRVALFCAQTGERHSFAGLEELFVFLLQTTTGNVADRAAIQHLFQAAELASDSDASAP